MRVFIKATNLELTPELKKEIKDLMSGLDKFNTQAQEVRVEVEHDAHHQKGQVFRVEANVLVKGDLIRVEKSADSLLKSLHKVKDHLKVILAKDRKKKLDKYRRR